jgi:diguanylate cyclase (GGDEF)-like protein
VLGSWALFLYTQYEAHLESAKLMAAGLAGMMEVNARRTFEVEELVANAVTSYVQSAGGMAGIRRDVTRHRAYLQKLAGILPSRGSIGIMELTGHPLFGSTANIPPGLSYADRDWFRGIVDGRPRYVGRAVVGKVRDEVIYPYAAGLYDPAGKLEGVLVISIHPQAVGRLEVTADGNSRLGIYRSDGATVARDPINTQDLAVDTQAVARDLRTYADGPMGSFIARSPFDDIERVVSFRRMPDLDLIVVAAIGKSNALHHWYRDFAFTGLMVVLMLGALAIVLPLVLRMVDREAEARAWLAAANERLAQLSATDQLLGIGNRRHFDEAIATAWRQSERTKCPLSLIMVDVDHFKPFNDLLGHQEGDGCLRQVADLMKSVAQRAHDVVARYGGEEFVVLLADTDLAGAWAVANRIRASVWERAIAHPGSSFGRVTVSVGVATLTAKHGQAASDLISMADGALYRAKELGRNRAEAWSAEWQHEV